MSNKQMSEMKFKNPVAIIQIRGIVKTQKDVKDTLSLLGLGKKFQCVIVEGNESNLGMIKKVKDYVTWGEIDQDTIKDLLSRRENKSKKDNKLIFNLHPPVGGFERGGIKKTFKQGGVLGYRGDKIKDLIQKMTAMF